MNNFVTPHFPLSSNLIHLQEAIHTGYRCDMITPGSALTEYLNHVTAACHNRKTGVTGAYALFYRQGILPRCQTAQEL
jgi:hypothetical protein